MNRIKNLHIVYPEKFFFDYVQFVNENFNPDDHLFLYLKRRGDENKAPNVKFMRYYRLGPLFYFELYKYASQSDHIILHSLAKSKVIFFLFLFRKFVCKCRWYVWGGDLYYRVEKYGKRFFNPFSKFIFQNVVGEIGAMVTHVSGDVEVARQHFGFKGIHIDCFLYPSNTFREIKLPAKEGAIVWVQVGNSSHVSNNHLDVLKKLEPYKDADIKILCPLSYGSKKNALRVNAYAQSIFGNKFVALLDFLPFEKYTDFLSKVDFAIFNHWRQQAIGNIVFLLGLGKTVYIRSDVTTWDMLKRKGIVARDFKEFTELLPLTDQEKNANIVQVKKCFSLEQLIEQSRAVFD